MALIDQIAAVGRPILILSGGEPLLRPPDIFDLAGYAAGRGLRVAMGTSGVLVTDASRAGYGMPASGRWRSASTPRTRGS